MTRKGSVPFFAAGAAAAVGAGFYVAAAGPLRIDLAGLTLSVRSPTRPLLAALILIALQTWLGGRAAAFAQLSCRALLNGIVVASVVGWGTFLSATCGGADSYGYVSAADRLLAGRLVEIEPLAAVLPFARGIDAATPLGYVASGRVADASVPAYPLGLPALMAVLRTTAGAIGPFLVAPLMGIVLLVAACAVARDWFGDGETTRIACALTAINPLVFTYAIQPMSDVPAAAAGAVAIAALSRHERWPVLAGLAAGLALVIRPALAPMALAIAAIPVAVSGRHAWKDSAKCLAPIAAAGLLQGWSQWYLYGDAVASGYGSVASLFSIERALFNTKSYAYWAFRALGPVWMGAAAVGLAAAGRKPRIVAALVTVSVGAPYLFYRPYDHWETLRFLLPALVVLTIVAAGGLMTVARSIAGASFGAFAAALIATSTAAMWVSWLSTNQVFLMPASEARHREAADLAAETTPANAVVLALQHTGNIRYYANRQTLNWDRIPAGSFDATVQALRARGFPVYLMLDSAEERAMFEARHGRVVDEKRWLPNGQRRNVQLFEAPH